MTDKPILIEATISGTRKPIIFNAACIVDMQMVSKGEISPSSDRWEVRYAVGDGEIMTVMTNRWCLNAVFAVPVEIPDKLPE